MEDLAVKRCDICNRKLTYYDYIDGSSNVKVCMSCALADMDSFRTLVEQLDKIGNTVAPN